MATRVLKWIPTNGLVNTRGDQLLSAQSCLILDGADLGDTLAISKLRGYEEVLETDSTGRTIDPFQVSHADNELVIADRNGQLYSDRFGSTWGEVGPYIPTDLILTVLAAVAGNQEDAHAACVGDLCLTAWVDRRSSLIVNPLMVAVQNIATGAYLVPPTGIDSVDPGAVSVIGINDGWLIVFRENAVNVLYVPVLVADLPVVPAPVLLANGANGVGVTALTALNNSALVGAIDNDGVTIRTLLFTAGVGGAGNVQEGTLPFPVEPFILQGLSLTGLDVDTAIATTTAINGPDRGWQSVRLSLATGDVISSVLRAPEPLRDNVTSLSANSTTTDVFIDGGGVFPTPPTTKRYTIFWGPLSFVEQEIYAGFLIASTPVVFFERLHMWLMAQTINRTQSYLFLDTEKSVIVARSFGNGQAGVFAGVRGAYNALLVQGTRISVALPFFNEASSSVVGTPILGDVGLALTVLETSQVPRPRCTLRGQTIQASGGMVQVYDGQSVHELDWHVLPEAVLSPLAGAILTGTYTYAIFWKWEDPQGRIVESAAIPLLITVNAQRVEISFAGLSTQDGPPTSRQNIERVIARSLADDASVLFVIATLPLVEIVFEDGFTDASIADNVIYTQLGAVSLLSNDAVPASRWIACVKDRVWFGDPQFPGLLRHSKPIALTSGVELNSTQFLELNVDSSVPSTAMAEQDGTFYGFSAETVANFSGRGPDAAGNGQFSTPERLPTTLGVESQLQVVDTPLGVIYGSSRGPRVLARDRSSISPFDRVNQLFKFEGQTIARAQYLADREETVLMSPETAQPLGPVRQAPRTLRYSHGTSRWTTESFAQGTDATRTSDGRFTILRTDGRLCTYNDSFRRGARNTSLIIGTSWLKVDTAKPFTLISVVLYGRFLSGHQLRVGLAYDYDDAITDLYEIDPARDQVRAVPDWEGSPDDAWSAGDLATDPTNTVGRSGWGQAASSASGSFTPITRYMFRLDGQSRTVFAVRAVLWDLPGADPVGAAWSLSHLDFEIEDTTEAVAQLDERLTY